MADTDTSFDKLVRAHYAQVFRFVRRRTSRLQDAEDITQTVFSQAISAFERSEHSVAPPLALLYTIARRRLIDAARRARIDTSLGEVVQQPADDYGEPLARKLTRSISVLPDTQRAVVLMKIVEGRSHAEIATALQITEGASRMHLNRGLTTLRERLEQEGVAP